MPKIELTQEESKQLKAFLADVKANYNMEQVMPQTDNVLKQFPGINPMGHYSEIDMGFAERNKRCEYALRMRDPLAWITYQDVRGKIEKTDAYKEMKTKMVEISQKVNVIDRAIRLSDNDRFVEYLEEQKEELKNDFKEIINKHYDCGELIYDRNKQKGVLYHVTRIGADIYILHGENEYVSRSQDDPDNVRLSINGMYYTNRTGVPYSLMLATADLQDLYDLTLFQKDNLIAQSGTKGAHVDMSQLPTWLGDTPQERLLKYLGYRKMGLSPIAAVQDGIDQSPLNNIWNGYDDNKNIFDKIKDNLKNKMEEIYTQDKIDLSKGI